MAALRIAHDRFVRSHVSSESLQFAGVMVLLIEVFSSTPQFYVLTRCVLDWMMCVAWMCVASRCAARGGAAVSRAQSKTNQLVSRHVLIFLSCNQDRRYTSIYRLGAR